MASKAIANATADPVRSITTPFCSFPRAARDEQNCRSALPSGSYDPTVSRFPEPSDPNDWQPATSRPGELYTVEGRIRAGAAFARGAHNKDPRLKEYRRSMRRAALVFVCIATGAGVLVAIITAVL